MAHVDLHVHSKYSAHPSEWYLQQLGASESYTEPETIYKRARERGMTWVTITDHDTIEGALRLQERHPSDVLIGEEVTAIFPEDGCPIHLLVYGLGEADHVEIQRLKRDIYALREYIRERRLAYAVAHATFAVNGKLDLQHIERLILLFDLFEGINGGRDQANNETWSKALCQLTPAHIEDLYQKYRIEPYSQDPWIKGLTGGSDDHAGLFIGQTYTVSEAGTIDQFLENLRYKKCSPAGEHSDYRRLAFTLCKLGCDYARSRGNALGTLLDQATDALFEAKPITPREKIKAKALRSINGRKKHQVRRAIFDLVEGFQAQRNLPLNTRLNLAYEGIVNLSDELLRLAFKTAQKDLEKGRWVSLLSALSSPLPGILLSVPFLSTLHHLSGGKGLLRQVQKRWGPPNTRPKKRILWFTDTLTDLNGVAVTLRKLGWSAYLRGHDLCIATALAADEQTADIPPTVINIPSVYHFRLLHYRDYRLKVPSMLRALEHAQRLAPDEIYISTPGPIGLLGLLTARLLHIKCVGVYHTDFAKQALEIVGDEGIANLLERYTHWFYTHMDEIRVPTAEYINILEARGFPRAKMRLFRRGIDTQWFRPRESGKSFLCEKFNIRQGITLLFVGRVSRDKGLDLLRAVYERILSRHPQVNLLIVGDGPYLKAFRESMRSYPRALFTGRLPHESLPEIYAGADLLLFPSATDTFGMAVLEAQACGLPALVSDVGGPQEIIVPDRTGWIAKSGNVEHWELQLEQIVQCLERDPSALEPIRRAARDHVLRHYDWDAALNDLLSEPEEPLDELIPPSASDSSYRSAIDSLTEQYRSPLMPCPAESAVDERVEKVLFGTRNVQNNTCKHR